MYGAADEWMWHTELLQIGRKVRATGLTSVIWEWDDCDQVDNKEGSPCAWLTWQSALWGCLEGRKRGYFFGRKYGDGSKVSTYKVVAGLQHCIDSNSSAMPSLNRTFARRAQGAMYGRTRSEMLRRQGKLPWRWTKSGTKEPNALANSSYAM